MSDPLLKYCTAFVCLLLVKCRCIHNQASKFIWGLTSCGVAWYADGIAGETSKTSKKLQATKGWETDSTVHASGVNAHTSHACRAKFLFIIRRDKVHFTTWKQHLQVSVAVSVPVRFQLSSAVWTRSHSAVLIMDRSCTQTLSAVWFITSTDISAECHPDKVPRLCGCHVFLVTRLSRHIWTAAQWVQLS